MCGSQQIKSDYCWTTCVYLNIIGRSPLFCFHFILIYLKISLVSYGIYVIKYHSYGLLKIKEICFSSMRIRIN